MFQDKIQNRLDEAQKKHDEGLNLTIKERRLLDVDQKVKAAKEKKAQGLDLTKNERKLLLGTTKAFISMDNIDYQDKQNFAIGGAIAFMAAMFILLPMLSGGKKKIQQNKDLRKQSFYEKYIYPMISEAFLGVLTFYDAKTINNTVLGVPAVIRYAIALKTFSVDLVTYLFGSGTDGEVLKDRGLKSYGDAKFFWDLLEIVPTGNAIKQGLRAINVENPYDEEYLKACITLYDEMINLPENEMKLSFEQQEQYNSQKQDIKALRFDLHGKVASTWLHSLAPGEFDSKMERLRKLKEGKAELLDRNKLEYQNRINQQMKNVK